MEPVGSVIATARSFLFVPGSKPDRFAKAEASGADVVILDLEDAVAPEHKESALDHVAAWLALGHVAVVRINAAGTPWQPRELSVLADLPCHLMIPKVKDANQLAGIADQTGGRLVALVETAVGVRDVDAIAAADGVERLALGTVDLAADLGIDPASGPALAYARGRTVMASAAAGLPPPVDGVTTALEDVDALRADARAARDLGFGAKLCIHPHQVTVVNESFQPSEREIHWATRVVAAAAQGGVAVVDGSMVDAPVVRRAQAILRRIA